MPVFDTQGDLLSTDLYNTDLQQKIHYDQFGGNVLLGTELWTGYQGGSGPGTYFLGNSSDVNVGSNDWTDSNWIHWSYGTGPSSALQMYAFICDQRAEPATGVLLLRWGVAGTWP